MPTAICQRSLSVQFVTIAVIKNASWKDILQFTKQLQDTTAKNVDQVLLTTINYIDIDKSADTLEPMMNIYR